MFHNIIEAAMAYLSNERIRLRALEPEDIDLLFSWENNDELWYLGNTTEPFSKYLLKDYIAHADRNIFQKNQLRLMVETVQESTTIGTIDLFEFNPHAMRAEVGVLIAPQYQHQGYATEALQLLIKYTSQFLSMRQLYAHVPLSNIPSQKLFRKCQFQEVGVLQDWIKMGSSFEPVSLFQLLLK